MLTNTSYQIQEGRTNVDPRREGIPTEKQESIAFRQETESTIVSPPDDNITEELLSMLSLSNRSTVSETEYALEKARMSHRERAETLSDLFGQMCSVNNRENKKPRLDLDRDSIDFLLCAMRSEIELIPVDKKSALIEAYANARKDEFSDDRLLKFLRCEKMNAKVRVGSTGGPTLDLFMTFLVSYPLLIILLYRLQQSVLLTTGMLVVTSLDRNT